MNKQEIDYELYRTEYYRHQSLHEKNLINQDNAMITLSIGLLAAMTAIGDKLITSNKTLAILGMIFLALTIIQVVIGYYLSNSFFTFVKEKLTENYNRNVNGENTRLDDGLKDSLSGKVNDFLNHTTYITFAFGLLFFFALAVVYIGGIHG